MVWRQLVRLTVGEVLKFETRLFPKPIRAEDGVGPHSNPEFRCVKNEDASVKEYTESPANFSQRAATVHAEMECPWVINPEALSLPNIVCFQFTRPGEFQIIETRYSPETGEVVKEVCHRVVAVREEPL